MASLPQDITVTVDQDDLARLESLVARFEAAADRLAPKTVTVNFNAPHVSTTADLGASLRDVIANADKR